jgi:hypothetical protein
MGMTRDVQRAPGHGEGNASAGRGVQEHKLHALLRMRRRWVAAAWIAGATVPLLLATIFLVGCCVLPFHGVMHRLMPVCAMAVNMMSGNHADHAQPPVPAREKQEPVKRIATVMPSPFRLAAIDGARQNLAPSPASAYRSYISLGAVRCDQDIGLHALVDTFRI